MTTTVFYKGTLESIDPDTGRKIRITSDGKSPIEMPDDIAKKLIKSGKATVCDEEPSEPQRLQIGKGKKGKKAPEGDKVPDGDKASEGDKKPEDGSGPV